MALCVWVALLFNKRLKFTMGTVQNQAWNTGHKLNLNSNNNCILAIYSFKLLNTWFWNVWAEALLPHKP